jgi:hypothetical protein
MIDGGSVTKLTDATADTTSATSDWAKKLEPPSRLVKVPQRNRLTIATVNHPVVLLPRALKNVHAAIAMAIPSTHVCASTMQTANAYLTWTLRHTPGAKPERLR